MSISGPDILDDDFAADVYDDFVERHRKGEKAKAITAHLETEYAEDRAIAGHEDVFWFALAPAQWKCGVLLTRVKESAERAVAAGRDPAMWEKDDPAGAKKRRAVLSRLVKKLQTPNRAPIAARPKKGTMPIFRVGDCLAVRLPDFDWTAALVTNRPEDILPPEERAFGVCIIAFLKWKSHIKPDISVFERREWLVPTHHSYEFTEKRPLLIPLCRSGAIAERYLVEVIGSIAILDSDPKEWSGSATTGSWRFYLDDVVLQERWDRGIREDVPMNFAQFTDPAIRQTIRSAYPSGMRYECTPEQLKSARATLSEAKGSGPA